MKEKDIYDETDVPNLGLLRHNFPHYERFSLGNGLLAHPVSQSVSLPSSSWAIDLREWQKKRGTEGKECENVNVTRRRGGRATGLISRGG